MQGIEDPTTLPASLFTGNILFIKKSGQTSASNFRPITCLSNVYKLLTKVVTSHINRFVEDTQFLYINQLGTTRRTLGAKEQILVNKAINGSHDNNLKTLWVDTIIIIVI